MKTDDFLQSLGVKPKECIYIDDYKPESYGARNVGFISFYLDRNSDKIANQIAKTNVNKKSIIYTERCNDYSSLVEARYFYEFWCTN